MCGGEGPDRSEGPGVGGAEWIAICSSTGKGVVMEVTAEDGTRLFVARDEAESGVEGPLYVVYRSEARETRWGFWCSNCDSLAVAVDTMGRIRCNDCGNLHRAEEWDAAHE